MKFRAAVSAAAVAGILNLAPGSTWAQDESELAKQLSNPIASLISVPFQFNWDENLGPDDAGKRLTANIQPVVPISLSEDLNLISRTILPVIDQQDIFPGSGSQSGIGDLVQSLFFSPVAPTSRGWIWGAGPVFLLPTASDDLLGADRWGLGPTGVALKQAGPWTVGALANHIWSVDNDESASDINATFLQPFLSYATPTGWSFTLQTESTYDWETKQWNVPIGMFAGKVFRIGQQPMQLTVGPRYYADNTDNGAKDWGFRAVLVLMYPK